MGTISCYIQAGAFWFDFSALSYGCSGRSKKELGILVVGTHFWIGSPKSEQIVNPFCPNCTMRVLNQLSFHQISESPWYSDHTNWGGYRDFFKGVGKQKKPSDLAAWRFVVCKKLCWMLPLKHKELVIFSQVTMASTDFPINSSPIPPPSLRKGPTNLSGMLENRSRHWGCGIVEMGTGFGDSGA